MVGMFANMVLEKEIKCLFRVCEYTKIQVTIRKIRVTEGEIEQVKANPTRLSTELGSDYIRLYSMDYLGSRLDWSQVWRICLPTNNVVERFICRTSIFMGKNVCWSDLN